MLSLPGNFGSLVPAGRTSICYKFRARYSDASSPLTNLAPGLYYLLVKRRQDPLERKPSTAAWTAARAKLRRERWHRKCLIDLNDARGTDM